jgi:hypothetical protein
MHYSIDIEKQDLNEFGKYFFVRYVPDFQLREDNILSEKPYSDFQEMISNVQGHITLMHIWGHDVVCKIHLNGILNHELSRISEELLKFCEEPVI